MRKALFLILILSNISVSSQTKDYRLGVFGSAQADLGLDASFWFRRNQEKNNNNNSSSREKRDFHITYGTQAQIGWQPLHWLGIAGGLRYSYISNKYHNVYAMVQPYFFLSPKDEEEKSYITLALGKQINNTQGFSNGGFVQLGIGRIDLMEKHIAQKIQLNLDVQPAGNNTIIFIGLSYGIVFHSRRYE